MKTTIVRIRMRHGAEYTLSESQGNAVRAQIANSTGSKFIHLTSLGVTINSADVSDIIDDFEDVPEPVPALPVGQFTEEDQNKRLEIIRKTRTELRAKGLLKSSEEEHIEELRARWKKLGLTVRTDCAECQKPLPPHLREFCSGHCFGYSKGILKRHD